MIDPDDIRFRDDEAQQVPERKSREDIPEPDGWRPLGYEW